MKVLVAEDNLLFQKMLHAMLSRWGYDAVVTGDGMTAWEILSQPDGPRLALLDWMMPGIDGPEICRRVRAMAADRYIYIVFVTARTESADLVAGMEAGADDYLKKPFNSHELRVRVRAGRRILDLQEELVGAREALRAQAMRDSLTNVWNHQSVFELLDRELLLAARSRTPVSVLMADMDNFKRINDTWGHLAGDEILREAARRIEDCVRRSDLVGRYGGEEFLIALPGCDAEHAAILGEKLRHAISGGSFRVAGGVLDVTCSLGVACTTEFPRPTVEDLIRAADSAMYAAKRGGRNRVEPSVGQDLSCAALQPGLATY